MGYTARFASARLHGRARVPRDPCGMQRVRSPWAVRAPDENRACATPSQVAPALTPTPTAPALNSDKTAPVRKQDKTALARRGFTRRPSVRRRLSR